MPMLTFTKHLQLSAIVVTGLALCAHGAQAPQRIDIKQLSKTVEDVVVPLPNEIFGALNKLGAVNWKEYVRSEEEGPNFAERAAYRPLAGDGDRRWFYSGASGGCACSKRYWPARPGTGQGDRRRKFNHATRQGDHRCGRQAQLGKCAAGTGSHSKQRSTGNERSAR